MKAIFTDVNKMTRKKKFRPKPLPNTPLIQHDNISENKEAAILEDEFKTRHENKTILTQQSLPPISSKVMFWRPRYLEQSQCLQYIPFYFWLTEILQPRVVVQPNISSGVGYFAICQVIDKLNQHGLAYGSFGEQGDKARITSYNFEHYQEFSSLTNKKEKEFLQDFRNQSIDLLLLNNDSILLSNKTEIANLRQYMSNDGIVLIHGSSSELMKEKLQVLKSKHSFFELNQGSGLLILCLGRNIPPRLEALITQNQELSGKRLIQSIYTRLGVACEDSWLRLSQEKELKKLFEKMEEIKAQHKDYQSERDTQHNYIEELKTQLSKINNEKLFFQNAFEKAKQDTKSYEQVLKELNIKKQSHESCLIKQKDEITELKCQLEKLTNLNVLLERDQEIAAQKISKLTHSESTLQQSLNKRFEELAILTKLLHEKDNQQNTQIVEVQPPTEIAKTSKPSITNKLKNKIITAKKNRIKARQFEKNVELVQSSELFDRKWYTKQYPDAENHPYGAAGHYLEKGFDLRANPSQFFNGSWYLQTYKDVNNVGMNPLLHYLKFGKKENRLIKRV